MHGLRSRWMKAGLALGCLYLLVSLIGAVAFVELSLKLPKHTITPQEEVVAKQRAAALGVKIEPVQVASAEGLPLRAWYVAPRVPERGVVILLHGVTDNRLGMGGFAEFFVQHGYGVLMPDARMHGTSGGDLATYGIREADDVHRWVAWLYAERRPRCVYGFGESMGAAILLQSLRAEPRFCAVVAESAFADFREAVYDRISGAFHAGPWLAKTLLRPTVEAGFLYADWKYGLDFSKSSPQAAVQQSRVPVLLIHGVRDSVIRLHNAHRIQASSPRVNLWEVPGAEHCGAWSTQPGLFEQRVLAWLAVHGG